MADQTSANHAPTDPDAPPEPDRLPDFGEFLLRYRNGGLHRELSEAFSELVQAVESSGKKKGSISLTLTVERQKMEGAVMVTDDINKAKIPQPERKSAADMFFIGDHGALLDEHPRQRTFGYDIAPSRAGGVQ